MREQITSTAMSAMPSAWHRQNFNNVIETPNVLAKKTSGLIQTKLTVASPDDPLEREADDMADKVMRKEIPSIHFSSSDTINRKCAECEKEEKEKLQRKENSRKAVSEAPPVVHDALSSSPGKSLDRDTRSFMEQRFHHDFGNVKIHDNDVAAKSADSINAQAYTSGNNIFFNSGQYDTSSDSGKRLLAHELTHVVQQNGSVHRANTSSAEHGNIQRRVSPDYSTIKDRLTRGLFDWVVTDSDARQALVLLRHLNPADLRDTVAQMERDGLVDTFFDNLSQKDIADAAEFLQQVQNNRTHSATSANGNTVTGTSSCNLQQANIMYQSLTTAQQWLDSAIARLGEFLGAPAAPGMANVRDALQTHVHTLNPAHIRLLLTRLQAFRTQMFSGSNLEVECAAPTDPLCKAMAAAYVQHGTPQKMRFCGSFFSADQTWRIEAMIHEAMHAFLSNSAGGTVTDRAYAHERVYEFLSPEEAFDNADSLAMLVEVLASGRNLSARDMGRPHDDISDCNTQTQLPLVRQAMARAARWTLNSINVVADTRAGFRQGYADLRRQYFGSDNIDRIPGILETYQDAKNKFEGNISVECETAGGACSSNTASYYRSFIFRSGTLHVCPFFFTLNEENRDQNFLTLTIMDSTGKSGDDANKYSGFAKAVTDRFWGTAHAL